MHMRIIPQYIIPMLLWFALTFLFQLLFRYKQIRDRYILCSIIFISYLISVCSITVFPSIEFGIWNDTGLPYLDIQFRRTELRSLNLVPFKTILSQLTGNIPELGEADRSYVGLINLLGNFFLFLPVGFLLPLTREQNKRLSSVLMFSILFSCIIEVIQYSIGRSVDIDDVILHSIGTIIGYGLWAITRRFAKS